MPVTVSWVVEGPRQMVPREFAVPEIGPEDVLLKVETVAICGSDPAHYLGQRLKPVFPLILGHELVGRVAAIGAAAAAAHGVREGDRVTVEPYLLCRRCRYCLNGNYHLCEARRCFGVTIPADRPPYLWGGYGEYLHVPSGGKLHRIADDLPAAAAALSSVVGNGFRWIGTRARVRWGESVVIIGAGGQGLVSVIAAHEHGAEPIVVLGLGRDAPRFALARRFGAHRTVDVEAEDPVAAVTEATGGQLADVVVECSGTAAALDLAAQLARPLGRIVVAGMSGKPSAVYVERIVRKELTILGGLGQAGNVEDAVRLLHSRRYPIEELVTHVFPVAQADRAIEFFIGREENCTRVALQAPHVG